MTTNGDREFDGIVIGAGHNGMILQGYLLKAGLSVAVVERHLEVGGGLDAHENPRAHGFWHNIHSQNHRAVPPEVAFQVFSYSIQTQSHQE